MTYWDMRPTIEQVRYCREKLDNLVLRKNDEWTGEQNHWLFGMIAETMIADLLGQERPLVSRESDDGADVTINGLRVDVKVTLRSREAKVTQDHAVVSHLQRNNNTDAYLFMSYNRQNGKYRVMGWITKEEWSEQHQFIPKGDPLPQETNKVYEATTDTMVLPYSDLHRLRSPEDLEEVGL